jgi:membrane-bound lytic murein transglycosylase D
MLSDVKLKYKSSVNYNRDALNVYGYHSTDIPKYNDSVIAYRMKLIESPIPMDYNNYVRAYVDLYSQRRRESVSKMLGAADYYFPMFEEILDKYNLPHEFKYLSVVESALNPNAQSWCGATGLWQFMYGTGLNYGLAINTKVDERRDPILATEAMCKYITNSYNQFGDWLLAIASYNCGPGWVAYAVRKGGSNNFWEIQQFLPAETRGYVPAFLAACYVFKYAPEHNLFPAEPDINYSVERVELDQSVSYYQLSQVLGVSISDLERLNPSFKKDFVSVGYKSEYINLPQPAAIKFWGNKQKVYTAPELDYSTIAINTAKLVSDDCPVASIDETVADSKKKEQIKEEAIDIPVKGDFKMMMYKVKSGDDLNYVCQRYNCDKEVIRNWNNLRDDNICEGEEIKIYVPKGSSN